MHSRSTPEVRSIFVVLQQAWEDQVLLDISRIVGIQSNKQKLSVLRPNALKWSLAEAFVQHGIGMWMEHGVCDA